MYSYAENIKLVSPVFRNYWILSIAPLFTIFHPSSDSWYKFADYCGCIWNKELV
jgi:hypothetical protein